jgi:hypothetical protein
VVGERHIACVTGDSAVDALLVMSLTSILAAAIPPPIPPPDPSHGPAPAPVSSFSSGYRDEPTVKFRDDDEETGAGAGG